MDECEARQGAVIAALWPRPRTPNRAVQRAPAPRASFRRVLPAKQALHLVEDRGGDALLRRALDLALAGSRHERDCVVLRLEADSLTAHVVVDDEADVLVREHRALAPEAGLAVVCAERDENLAGAAARAELAQDVCRRLELERPGLRVLRALGRERLGRRVVGGRGGHDDD